MHSSGFRFGHTDTNGWSLVCRYTRRALVVESTVGIMRAPLCLHYTYLMHTREMLEFFARHTSPLHRREVCVEKPFSRLSTAV